MDKDAKLLLCSLVGVVALIAVVSVVDYTILPYSMAQSNQDEPELPQDMGGVSQTPLSSVVVKPKIGIVWDFEEAKIHCPATNATRQVHVLVEATKTLGELGFFGSTPSEKYTYGTISSRTNHEFMVFEASRINVTHFGGTGIVLDSHANNIGLCYGISANEEYKLDHLFAFDYVGDCAGDFMTWTSYVDHGFNLTSTHKYSAYCPSQ